MAEYDLPAYLQPKHDDPTTWILPAMQMGAQRSEFDQQMALKVKDFELQKKSQFLQNALHLQKLQDIDNEMADTIPLNDFAKDPSQPIPSNFKSPNSFQKAKTIQDLYDKTDAGRAITQAHNDYIKRIDGLTSIDQITVGSMMADANQGKPFSRWSVTPLIARYIDDAAERAPAKKPAAVVNSEAVTRKLNDAQKAEDNGNPDVAASLRREAADIESALVPGQETIETYTDEAGNQNVRVIKGGAKSPASPLDPTTAFKTRLQEQRQAYGDAFNTLDYISKNMDSSDFGLRGVAKENWAKLAGQLGVKIDPDSLDVRKALGTLRASLVKSLKSDSNITDDERKQISAMLPSSGLLESVPDVIASLQNVKREIVSKDRTASARLGVIPSTWAMSKEEIAAAFTGGEKALAAGMKPDSPEFKAKFLTADQAAQAYRNLMQ